MTDCILHPENLKPKGKYEFIFRSALAEDFVAGKVFSVIAVFKSLSIGESEVDNEVGSRLKVVMRVGKGGCLRHVSWSRITKITELEVENDE